ncbi:MAG: hypothetical protein KGS48_08525 [Bacteroidetes bacterium]|nr:hypothetical protein [Bacteroidota bacterium]
MNFVFSVAVRVAFTFVAFFVLQYMFHYLVLVIGGLLAGLFFWKVNGDRSLGLGVLIGSVLFAVFAYLYGNV